LHTNWNTPAFPDGRYQIDVVVCDIQGSGANAKCAETSGHSAGRSRIVRVHNAAGGDDTNDASFKDIWIADSNEDVGAIPSNVGGHSYWESPDILVVREDSDTGPDPSKRVNELIQGQHYHVYVQVHYGLCNTINHIKVALASAAQSTFNSQSSWKWITQPNSTFIGPPDSPDGVTMLPKTSTLWVGPFDWTPSTEEVGSDGHRCLLAAVTSDEDLTNTGDMTKVPDHNNVAQRNVQIGKAVMMSKISNPFSYEASVALRFSSPDMTKPYVLTMDYDASLEGAWAGTANTQVAHVGNRLVATFKANDVNLPAVALPGYAEKPFLLTADGPIGTTVTVRMTENTSGGDVGGMTMSYTVPNDIP
jgi:hypothetical protein